MSNLARDPSYVNLDLEQLQRDAERLAGMLKGALALLAGDCPARAVNAARENVVHAAGVLTDMSITLDAMVDQKQSAERAEQAHRAEAARIAGGAQ